MKKRTRNILFGSLLFAGLASATAVYAINNSKKAEKDAEDKKKYELKIKQLSGDNKKLNEVYSEISDSQDYYSKSAKNYKVRHPEYDDMDSLFNMTNQLAMSISNRYAQLECDFEQKVVKIGIKFCDYENCYVMNKDGTVDSIMPDRISDWMELINTYADQVPNIDSLNQEYDNLNILDELVWNFRHFIDTEFTSYVHQKNATKKANMEVINQVIKRDTTYLPSGFFISTEEHAYVDGDVRQYNNIDNIKQNKIIDRLLHQYLYKFIVYDGNNIGLLDERLVSSIRKQALVISQHNDIESGVISYEKKKAEISEKIAENKAEILKLQDLVKVR